MNLSKTCLGVCLATLVATPAGAAILEVRYSGVVVAVFSPATADGVVAGDLASVRLRFDPAQLMDVTANANAAYGTGFTDLKAATLTGPQGLLDITVGPNHFAATDQFPYFPDPGLGAQPVVLFNNGAFFGLQFGGLNPAFSSFVTAGAAPEPFDFVGGNFFAGGPSYAGFFDKGSLTIASVPEPSTWMMMICGLGLVGAIRRSRRGVALLR